VGQNRFERDTAVATVDEGRYRGRVDPGWAVIAGAAPNGGYLLAMAARAMRDPVRHPDPVTITAHFLAPPQPGEIDIEVEVVRTGRRHSTVQGRMVQDGRETLRAIATFGDLDAADGPTRVDRPRPPLPRFEDCIDATTAGVEEARAGGFQAPPGKQMGHAGAIITGSSGTAQAKKDALEAKGIRVGTNPTEVAELVKERLG
jgi:hypothetical protein